MWCFILSIARKIGKFFSVFLGLDLIGRNKINLSQHSTLLKIIIYPFWYLLQVLSALFDILFLGELLSWLGKLTNKNVRDLTKIEMEYITEQLPIYISLVNLKVIENSWIAKLGAKAARSKQMGVCVGTGIHFSRKITSSETDLIWLTHECAHTTQFKQRGVIYIFEALIAQQFSGYNYKLKDWQNHNLKAFNPEQQAEILSKETKGVLNRYEI